ncbi:MAG TPA: hypothetical protein VMA31_03215 [Bryobacteraceae bacterium]|nr:hypothetical protein [Bryobacteraceae bacterium]
MLSFALRGVAMLLCGGLLGAQSADPNPTRPTAGQPGTSSQPAGFETSWEIAPVFTEISSHAGRLGAVLAKIDGQAWVRKGASETYAAQLDSSRQQVRAMEAEAKALAANPDRLSAALVLLFRIQGVDTMLPSVEEAMRKYQSPAEAQALTRLAAENGLNRDRVQNYVVNLASEREQDLKVMDEEAQRCRSAVTAVPTAARKKK